MLILTLLPFLGVGGGVEGFAEVKRNERTRTFKRSANQSSRLARGSNLGPWSSSSTPVVSLVGWGQVLGGLSVSVGEWLQAQPARKGKGKTVDKQPDTSASAHPSLTTSQSHLPG